MPETDFDLEIPAKIRNKTVAELEAELRTWERLELPANHGISHDGLCLFLLHLQEEAAKGTNMLVKARHDDPHSRLYLTWEGWAEHYPAQEAAPVEESGLGDEAEVPAAPKGRSRASTRVIVPAEPKVEDGIPSDTEESEGEAETEGEAAAE
jgi:hypothetical protein